MDINDLIKTPNSQLTVEELEEKLRELRKLKVSSNFSPKAKRIKTNKDTQLEDLLKNLPPEKLQQLLDKLKQE